MKALIDTNVILDVFLERALFFEDSWKVMRMAEARDFSCYISSFAITDIFYFAQKKFKNIELVYKKIE